MEVLTAQRMAASAYRTLGLPASATQAQVDAAARRLRIWADPKKLPTTPWDSPWPGPVPRSRNDIEQAVSALIEPATRIEERLLWFHRDEPALWEIRKPGALAGTLRLLSAANDPASVHDLALANLQLALIQDPQFLDADRWHGLMDQLAAMAHSEGYQTHLLALETDGCFEKPATRSELSDALHAIPQAVAGAMASRAEAALENDDLPAASQVLATLRNLGGAIAAGADCEERILDRLEDILCRRCDQMHQELNRIGSKKVRRKKITSPFATSSQSFT